MTLKLEITGETPEEIATQAKALIALFSAGADTAKPATAASTRGGKSNKAAEATQRAAGSTGAVVAPPAEPEDDGLGEGDGDGLEDEPVTRDQVKDVLVALKRKFPNDSSAVKNVVQSASGVEKFADIPDDKLAAVFAAAQKKLG